MFDTPAELLDKIRLGEDSLIEFKSITCSATGIREPHPDSLAQELAAFANSAKGGVLILGVSDKTRELEGMSPADLDAEEQTIRNLCNDRIDPPLTCTIERLELPDSLGIARAILKVDVPRSLFVHRAPGGYFERIGSSKREVATARLERLMQQRSQSGLLLFDEQPVPGTSPDTLDPELAGRFVSGTESPTNESLHKLGVLTFDPAGKECCTVAGVLLGTRNPEAHLHSGALIEAVQFAGIEQDSANQINARRISGPVDRQIIDAFAFLRGGIVRSARKEPARVETPAFSERAIFEALVNAVIHRDYSIAGSKIRLFLFEDRMEIYSPGGLPNTLTIASMAHRQFTRNETLVGLLNRLDFTDNPPEAPMRRGKFMETRGDGIKVMQLESKRIGALPPKIELIDDAELRLTLFAVK